MPRKQVRNKQESVLPTGGGAPAPYEGNPGLLQPTPGMEGVVPPAYRGQVGREGPSAPGGQDIPHNQAGPGTAGSMSPPAWAEDWPSLGGPRLRAHQVHLTSCSCSSCSSSQIPPSSSFLRLPPNPNRKGFTAKRMLTEEEMRLNDLNMHRNEMLAIAQEIAFHLGFKIKAGIENTALGDCLLEVIRDQILFRPELHLSQRSINIGDVESLR